jgi:gas vesicle protein
MDTVKTILAFMTGAAAGAVVALLLAPESGEKTRERIRAKAAGAASSVKEKILEGLDAAETILEEE